jgi:hypothetical protein
MNTTGNTLTAPAIQPTNREGVYRARSDSGRGSYLCSPVGDGWCLCAAGERGKACKHVERARHFVADALREQAAKRGIVVLRGQAGELLAPDFEVDLYGPADELRARAAAMGIRVLLGHSEAEPVGADAPAGDLYGPADE